MAKTRDGMGMSREITRKQPDHLTDDPSALQARRVQPLRFTERVGSPALQGPEPAMDLPMELRGNILVTTIDKLVSWARKSSLWPMAFGLA